MSHPTVPSELEEYIKLDETCGACPEQYDMYFKGKYVGYFRLRWGHFTVRDENLNNLYYEADTKGHGCFDSDERDFFLTMGKLAVLNAIGEITLKEPLPEEP